MNGSSGLEERESLLSAMYDGEVSAGEGDLIARRLARDRAMRLKWSRYAVAAAVLRGDQQFLASARFAARLAGAIAEEPVHGVDESVAARLRSFGTENRRPLPGGPLGAAARWWRPLTGVAVAAGVATAAILVLRSEPAVVAVAQLPPAARPALAVAENAANDAAASSYVTPRYGFTPANFARGLPTMVPPAQLANYVVAHSEYSNPLGRSNLLSALMAGESFGNGAAAWPGTGPAHEADANAPAGVRATSFADGSALDEPAGAGDADR
jgi:negative regulator of sigma E activity